MKTLRVLVVGILLSAVVFANPQVAGSYAKVVDLFRRGDDELALTELGELKESDIRVGRDALLKATNSASFAERYRAVAMVRAAAVLHTVRAFSARGHDDPVGFRDHFRLARGYIDELMSKDRAVRPFVQTWHLFVLASFHAQSEVTAAREFSRRARDPHGDSALMLLALGATEEMGWLQHQEETMQPFVDGDLKQAERSYRQALVVAPDLVEARLRLGRVLTLLKDDAAARMFAQIADTTEAPYQYLARLFEGDLQERAGNGDDAERQYLAAVSLLPSAQSAFVALAHVRHARGARADAARDIRVTTGARAVPDRADPWYWYILGTAWRGQGYLDDLHKMIAP